MKTLAVLCNCMVWPWHTLAWLWSWTCRMRPGLISLCSLRFSNIPRTRTTGHRRGNSTLNLAITPPSLRRSRHHPPLSFFVLSRPSRRWGYSLRNLMFLLWINPIFILMMFRTRVYSKLTSLFIHGWSFISLFFLSLRNFFNTSRDG